ncbi:50S ribosomal protein L21 [Candidatus Gracilibacteria bacterium]|nr:MAG: 50S ribosomal protein L21 [Candidatus Gracilibacteria bacterium]PIE85000.1 MAG: 50S ribosomal protein L21 [Candidatus Gracilibacteria bacterium]
MIAVIELGGNQFIVRKGDIIEVKKQNNEVDSVFTVEALLTSDEEGKETKVGNPLVKGSKVELKVLDQLKGEKVRVFHMKSKKRSMKNRGFRPHITKLEVLSIS